MLFALSFSFVVFQFRQDVFFKQQGIVLKGCVKIGDRPVTLMPADAMHKIGEMHKRGNPITNLNREFAVDNHCDC